MDGAKFEISIEANSIGVDSSTAQLNAFAERVQQANTVATQFDKAIAATRARLTEASAAAQLANGALAISESRYKELESAANKTAKALEKARVDGKDTTALQAAAEAATGALRQQASAVDELRARSKAAVGSQAELTDSLKKLETQQVATVSKLKSQNAAVALKKTQASAADLKSSLSLVGGSIALVATSLVVLSLAAFGAVAAMAKFAITSNPKAMERLTAAQDKAKKGFTALFSGVKTDKFIGALEDILSIFDEGTSTANGMKTVVETILQPLFDAATKAGPFVKEMFKGMIYGALRVVNAVLSLRNEIFKALSPQTRAQIKSVTDAIFTMENAFTVGEIAAVSLLVVFGLLAAALGIIAVVATLAAIPFFLMLLPLALITAAIVYFDEIVAAVKETLSGWVSSAKTAASDLINGLVNGIKSGAGLVWDAIRNMAAGGIKAFTDKFKIGSPSKVMQVQGTWIAEGAAEGIDDGAPKVQSALESMVSPADVGAGGVPVAGSTSTSTASSSRAVHIAQLTINAPSGEADSIAASVKRALLEVVEGNGASFGNGEAVAT